MADPTTRKSTLTYRPDIDGLRAVAVLLVVAFHTGIGKFRGGFVGVDVFFVISGYLISSVILAEISAGHFSIAAFYERRIRRIFPALVVMMFVTSFLAAKYFLPTELTDFAKSLLAATFSVSNIYFWRQSGYFDAPAALKPLLHTWSLAVEEQFYIVFPLFLVLIRKFFPNRLRAAVVLLALASFVVSAYGAFYAPTSTFYMLHTRAWELLLGTVISLNILPDFRTPLLRNAAALVGLALIVASGVFYTSNTPFPGIAALAPCVGSALIISAGKSGSSVVGRALALKPVVFIGLISYSLYLWHWPIIVFQGVGTFLVSGVSERMVKVAIIAASLLAGTISWKFVEIPFRSGRLKLTGAAVFRAAFAAVIVLAALGSSALAFRGFPSRYSPEAVRVAAYMDVRAPYREGTCFITSSDRLEDFDTATCLREDSTKKNYLLIGDSHAAQLWYGLSTVLKDVNVMQATASGCKPTLEQPMNGDPKCRHIMNYVFQDFLPSHSGVDTLLIAGRWESNDVPRLTRTISWAQSRGMKVVVFGPMLQYDSALPRLLATSIRQNDPSLPFAHRVDQYVGLDRQMAHMAQNDWHVRYISYFQTLCNADSCVEYVDGDVPLQSDYSHLTKEGSVWLVEKLQQSGELP
jgi:peptidoglycan/LPS O-acetylase OafA/YrhL